MIWKLISFLTAFIPVAAFAQSVYVPRDGQIPIRVLQSSEGKPLHEIRTTPFTIHGYSSIGSLDLDAVKGSHPYKGIGVSLTDASCWWLWEMGPQKRAAFLKDAFTKEGMNLSLIRLNCGASDYATELYNYDDVAGDVDMKYFSVARDELYMIPIIREVQALRPDVYTYSAIWSEPGWMKTSGAMCGGALKDEYLQAYANYMAAYVKAYKEHGVTIDAMSVHNEPETDQAGGCPASIVTADQEMALAGKFIPAAFRKAGVADTDIWIWDYDYAGYERVLKELSDPKVRKNVKAVAWHPYSGSPTVVQEVMGKYPEKEMHLTERGPNLQKRAVQTHKWFADVVFGALNNGCSSYSSWNLILDEDGQPVTGKYPCGGLREINSITGEITDSKQAELFRQFCPYIEIGAEILDVDQPDPGLATIAFRNPDGTLVVVIVADTDPGRRKFQIKYKSQYLGLSLPLGTWSMTTVIIGKRDEL